MGSITSSTDAIGASLALAATAYCTSAIRPACTVGRPATQDPVTAKMDMLKLRHPPIAGTPRNCWPQNSRMSRKGLRPRDIPAFAQVTSRGRELKHAHYAL